MKPKLKIPAKLVVVALGAVLSGCGGARQPANGQCPTDYYCTTDAARAFNCTDAADNSLVSDLGACYPPV